MQQNKKLKIMILIALGVVFNVALAALGNLIGGGLLFLDTVGTIFIAAFFGPVAGILTGVLTNLVNGVISSPMEIPFALVNAAVGLIVGLVAKKTRDYNLVSAILVGLALAVICPLIGTPIAVWLFNGLGGNGFDFIVIWLKESGSSIFTAAFLPRIVSNLLDKVASSVLVFAVLRLLPANILQDSILDKLKEKKEKKDVQVA